MTSWQIPLNTLFQSTFPRGERRIHQRRRESAVCFNPRSHEGNDGRYDLKNFSKHVSIHVPTRGTTKIDIKEFLDKLGFQSTFPRGERRVTISQRTFRDSFNPRSHEGNDVGVWWMLYLSRCFNPRSHEGNDLVDVSGITVTTGVSIHVPTRGTTWSLRSIYCFSSVSIHVPTRGTTPFIRSPFRLYSFQSTFPRGERRRA